MAGTLYIVATPIGNLDDMPPRVAATFGAADFIAAEDTRVTMKLLNFLGLKKPMVSYYEHALQKGEAILQRIEAGESCALCSDAGMPCVSDPGEVIVRDALARGIKVVPVPAASACVTALAVSGQDTSRWVFEGFLPVNRKQKKERLADLLHEKRTVIFYEAPHKLRTTLDDLTAAFGPERSITLCRELTKLHEEIWKTTLGEAVEHYRANDPRGEYVLVMAGAPAGEDADAGLTLEQAAQRALELTGEGFGPTAAAKAAAQGTPYSRAKCTSSCWCCNRTGRLRNDKRRTFFVTKLLVLSDSHGGRAAIERVLLKENANIDALVFLGDGLRDLEQALTPYPRLRAYSVAGNCDYGALEPMDGLAAFDQAIVFYTHGHMYGVKYDLDTLTDAAAARGAELALFGHTHVPHAEQRGKVFLFNPGSCGRCYTGPDTYGLLTLENGKVTAYEHKEVPKQ